MSLLTAPWLISWRLSAIVIEFGRRYDGKFNIWQLTEEEGWVIRDVKPNHEQALARVRELRAERG